MSNLWINLKRNRVMAKIYHDGKYIMTLNVSEQNKGNTAILDLTDCEGVRFVIIKSADEESFNNLTLKNE